MATVKSRMEQKKSTNCEHTVENTGFFASSHGFFMGITRKIYYTQTPQESTRGNFFWVFQCNLGILRRML
jgi:hypothetical protein